MDTPGNIYAVILGIVIFSYIVLQFLFTPVGLICVSLFLVYIGLIAWFLYKENNP